MTRVPAPGRDTSISSLEDRRELPLKSKSHVYISKKRHISPKTGHSTTSKLWPPPRALSLLLRRTSVASKKGKKNNDRNSNTFGQQHRGCIKSWLGQLNPHALRSACRHRAERDISTFVETQEVLFSPWSIGEQEDAQRFRSQPTEQLTAREKRATATELAEPCLAGLARKGHRWLIQS